MRCWLIAVAILARLVAQLCLVATHIAIVAPFVFGRVNLLIAGLALG
jgi:hypothetical protein